MKLLENVVKGTINCGTGMLSWTIAKRFVPPTANPVIKALYFAGVFGISQAVMDITSKTIEKDIADIKSSFYSFSMERDIEEIKKAILEVKKERNSKEMDGFADILFNLLDNIEDPKEVKTIKNIIESGDMTKLINYMKEHGYEVTVNGEDISFYYKKKEN